MTRIARGCSAVGILVALLVTGFIFAMRGCLSKYDERIALPPALYFKKDSSAVLLSLIKYSKTNSYSRSGGFTQKTVSNYYYIQSNDAVSGSKTGSEEIGTDVKHFPEKMLGADGRNAWVFLNELMAFDAFTLQKVADIEIIEAKNPSLSGMMPAESSYYEFDETTKTIIFTSNDGAGWQLDLKSFIAKPYEKIKPKSPESPAERAALQLQDRLKQLSELNLHFNQFKINQDTIDGRWLGLYSKNEMGDLHPAISFSPAHEQDQRRQIYIAGYDSMSPGYAKFIDPVLQHTGVDYFLDAGFMVSKETGKAIRLNDPSGYLLVYKTIIGETGEIMIARIAYNGTVLWKLNTSLKKWIDYQVKDNLIIIFGNDHKKLSSSYCTMFLSVNIKTGLANKYDYFVDELRK